MSVIGRDVMERAPLLLHPLPRHGFRGPPALKRSGESLSHTDMQTWTAASSHNRPEAVRSAAALLEARSRAGLGWAGPGWAGSSASAGPSQPSQNFPPLGCGIPKIERSVSSDRARRQAN